jgi:hypothetical protein
MVAMILTLVVILVCVIILHNPSSPSVLRIGYSLGVRSPSPLGWASTGNWRAVDLSGFNLNEADLSDSILDRADLTEADLSGANLEAVYLREANLRGVEATKEQLSAAKSLEGATMPDGTVHE